MNEPNGTFDEVRAGASEHRRRARTAVVAGTAVDRRNGMRPAHRTTRLMRRLAVFVVLHLAALSLAWAVATLVSRSHADLSAGGSHLRLIPLTGTR